jgi:hypothetical protein
VGKIFGLAVLTVFLGAAFAVLIKTGLPMARALKA